MQSSGVGEVGRSGKQRIQQAPTIFGMTRFVDNNKEISRPKPLPRKSKAPVFDQRAELTEVYGAEAPIQRPSPTVLLTLAGGARRSYLIWIALRELNQSYQGYQDFIIYP